MQEAIITRYLADENVPRLKDQLGFLLEFMHGLDFERELALEIRGLREICIYDRGNRLAKIIFRPKDRFWVETHRKFVESTPLGEDGRFASAAKPIAGNCVRFDIPATGIHPLLQKNHIVRMRSRIKDVNYKEELRFAHMIAADNLRGPGLVVIDREVGDSAEELQGQRLDLLALQCVDATSMSYRFLAMEVKLGNNPELDEKKCEGKHRTAREQLAGYVEQLERYHAQYVECYRKNIAQKIELGLLNAWKEPPNIVKDARGLLVVVAYAGLAESRLKHLKEQYPEVDVKLFDYGMGGADGTIDGLFE